MNTRICNSVQVLLLACSFILCWTPYAVLALTSVVGVSQSVSPLVTLLPHQLAKSSVLWDSLILIVHNPLVSKHHVRQTTLLLLGRGTIAVY